MNRMKVYTGVVVLLAASAAWGQRVRPEAPIGSGDPDLALRPAEINLRHTPIVEVVRKTKDAVVNISATKKMLQRISPLGRSPFWDPFDDEDEQVEVQSESLGSGFIIHPDGYIITNNHVIDRARSITVELSDGRKIPADLLSSDADADLAILKIASPKPLPFVELGDSSDLMIGEPVIAVGNPFGYSQTVSTGIISAIRRELKDNRGKVIMKDLVQTDAAINPGNSGGPLINAYGQVIGINTAIRGDAQNIGFAINVNKLRELIPELMSPAHVRKLDVPIQFVERRELTPPAHVRAQVLVAGEDGVVVRTIDGRRPANIVDAYAMLLRAKPEDRTISIELADGQRRRVPVKVVAPPAIAETRRILGVTVEQLTPMLAEKHGVDVERGVVVTEVVRNGAAAKIGLRPSDVIVQLGRYRVSTLNDLSTVLKYLPEHGRVQIGVIRKNQLMLGTLEL